MFGGEVLDTGEERAHPVSSGGLFLKYQLRGDLEAALFCQAFAAGYLGLQRGALFLLPWGAYPCVDCGCWQWRRVEMARLSRRS